MDLQELGYYIFMSEAEQSTEDAEMPVDSEYDGDAVEGTYTEN